MKGNFLQVYWDFFDELTPEAATFLSYLVDIKKSGMMKKWDGNYFRLSNSFIQERFLTWSHHIIKKHIDELEAKGFIQTKQLFMYENGSTAKTRWVLITDKTYNLINGLSNNQTNDHNNDLTNDLTKNFSINNNTITQEDKNTRTQDNIYSSQIKEIIDYLNQKANTSYRTSTERTQKLIIAKLKQKFTVEDFKHVIDVKCADWLNSDFAQYLRPETLFGNKFESYLNSKVSKPLTSYKTPATTKNEPSTPPKKVYEECTLTPEEIRAIAELDIKPDFTNIIYY